MSVWNVYNRKNVAALFWNDKEQKQDQNYQWQVLPIFGLVAPGISDFELKSFKHTVGIGLRYRLVPAEKINMRLDFGWGKDSSGFYLALTEAF